MTVSKTKYGLPTRPINGILSKQRWGIKMIDSSNVAYRDWRVRQRNLCNASDMPDKVGIASGVSRVVILRYLAYTSSIYYFPTRYRLSQLKGK